MNDPHPNDLELRAGGGTVGGLVLEWWWGGLSP